MIGPFSAFAFAASLFGVQPPAAPEVLTPSAAEAAPIAGEAAGSTVFAGESDEQIFERAVSALESTTTMKARFLQRSPSGTDYEGTLSLKRPGLLRFEYDAPNPQLIVATNGVVYVHDADLETTDSYPVSETPLRFLLAKRIDADEAVLANVFREEDRVTLFLTSPDDETGGELVLTFDAPAMTLSQWAVREPNGARTVVTLRDVETGVKLSNQLFRRPDSGGTFLRDR